MNYIYLIAGIVLGAIYLGRSKNAGKQKFVPYEAKMKLKNKKTIEQYDEWCNTESKGCLLIGLGFIIFALSATFMDSSAVTSAIIAIISLIVFVIGFMMRVVNNKKHLGHYFTKQ